MSNRITYDSMTPLGAGAGYKVERVPSPPVRGHCFAAMQSSAELAMMCASAPEDHRLITERIKRMGKVRGEDPQGQEIIDTRKKVKVHAAIGFGDGATVKVTSGDHAGRKGIIIQANAGYTAKTRRPVHRVSDSKGRSWLEKESHLKLIY